MTRSEVIVEALEFYRVKLEKERQELNEKISFNPVGAEIKLMKKFQELVKEKGALHEDTAAWSKTAAVKQKKIKRIRAWQKKNMMKAIEKVSDLEWQVICLVDRIAMESMRRR